MAKESVNKDRYHPSHGVPDSRMPFHLEELRVLWVEETLLAGINRSNRFGLLLTVNSCIKVRLDLQADKSPVVVKGPFFPRVMNPRYRIRGTMCNARIQSSKARKAI
jgi:hypothetical protein